MSFGFNSLNGWLDISRVDFDIIVPRFLIVELIRVSNKEYKIYGERGLQSQDGILIVPQVYL